jgi:hypothetical protein
VGELLPPLSPGSGHPELNGRQEELPTLLPRPSVLTRQDKRKWEEEEGSQVFEELGRVVSMGAQLQSEYTAVLQLPRSPKRMKVVMGKLDSLGQRKRLLNGRVMAFTKKKEELRKEEKTTCSHCRASLNSERSRYFGIQYTALYIVHYTLLAAYCTLFTLHTAHYTLHISHDKLDTANYSILHNAQTPFTLHNAYCILRTVHCILYAAFCTLHTVHCTMHTAHCSLLTAHCALHTAH